MSECVDAPAAKHREKIAKHSDTLITPSSPEVDAGCGRSLDVGNKENPQNVRSCSPAITSAICRERFVGSMKKINFPVASGQALTGNCFRTPSPLPEIAQLEFNSPMQNSSFWSYL